MKKAKLHKLVAMAVSVFMLLSMLPGYALAVETDNGLPTTTTTEYRKLTSLDDLTGDSIAIVSTTYPSTADTSYRIMHISNSNSGKLDQCRATSVGDTLQPIDCELNAYAGTHAHDWIITAVDGGYTIQSKTTSGVYININGTSAAASSEAQVLTIEPATEAGTFYISREEADGRYYLTHNSNWMTASKTPYAVYLYQRQETVVQHEIASGKPADGDTTGQPFSTGTAGSQYFRIPSLITLNDSNYSGRLLAATDARYNHTGDACALDTIVSWSDDNGATWHYTFANYFNDSTDAKDLYATAFIDPVMVQGNDGTVYLMVDVFPGGVAINTAPMDPAAATGYVNIDGTQRLVLYADPTTANQTDTNYTHYVGDFGDAGFAPVYPIAGGEAAYYVDEYYNLYNEKQEPVYCPQLGSTYYVQQNVFYYNADLHVRNASYLWLITSKDGGETWSAPTILNDQVRTGNNMFYGVGPGAGLCLEDGTIMLPCYTFTSDTPNSSQIASFIYSTDGGQTWTRSQDATTSAHWSSESCLVQIDDDTVRHFYRDGYSTLYYTDHTRRADGTWVAGTPVNTGVSKTYGNQLSAIQYSETIDGKPAILVSTADGGANSRANGKIYTFLLNEDNTLELAYTYSVTSGYYAYSSLTELDNGSIGLLYENTGGSELYVTIPITDVAEGALIRNARSLTIPLYGGYSETLTTNSFSGFENIDTSIVQIESVNNNDTYTVTYKGLKDGTVTFTESSSGIKYTITVAPTSLVEVSVDAGETLTINDLPGSDVTHEADASIAAVSAKTDTVTTTYTSGQGNLGSDANYDDELVPLSNALYTFKKNTDGTYTIESASTSGLYLNLATAGIPNSASSCNITLTDKGSGNFSIYSATYSRYLYFWRNGNNYFDRNSSYDTTGCPMLFFRPANEGEESTVIPGYVQVTSLTDITDGGQYLIAALYNNSYYALYPSNTNDKFAHVIKVYPNATYTQESSYMTITGVSAGTTDVMVNGTTYRITVNGSAEQFVLGVSDDDTVKVPATLCSGEGTGTVFVEVSADNIADNYSTAAYPTTSLTFGDDANGYVFAGWYDYDETTGEYTACASFPTDTAYAKFVDEDVLQAMWQMTAGTTSESESTNLRFVTTVDTLDYEKVGFVISIDGMGSTTVMTTTVYEHIEGYTEEGTTFYSPKIFSEVSNYFMTYKLNNVPSSAFNKEFTVVPQWITYDGTTVTGQALIFTIQNQLGSAETD